MGAAAIKKGRAGGAAFDMGNGWITCGLSCR